MNKILTLFLTLMLWTVLPAQTVVLEGLEGHRLVKSGAIENNDDVAGYFKLYKGDRIKKVYEYKLEIFDQNMKLAKTSKFKRIWSDHLLQAVFNNDLLVFKFINGSSKDDRKVTYLAYNGKGEEVFTETRPTDKKELIVVNAQIKQDNNFNSVDMKSIEGKGFVDYHVYNSKKTGYALRFVGNDGSSWYYKSDENAKSYQGADYIGHDNLNIYSIISKKASLLNNKKIDIYIAGHSLSDGSLVFENILKNDKYDALPIKSFINSISGNVMILNSTYRKGDGLTGTPTGLEILEINPIGEILSTKNLNFAIDAKKFANVKNKGKFDDLGYLYFHNIVPTEDGFVFLAESFKKKVSGFGVATTALAAATGGSPGAALLKVVADDFVLFTVDSEMNIQSMDIIEKPKHNIELPAGVGYASVGILGHMIKAYGWFALSFDQLFIDEKKYAGFYYSRNKEAKAVELGIIKINNGEIDTDKITVYTRKDKKKDIDIFPAKKGYVLKRVSEKVKKKWTYTYTFEKIDI